MAFTTKRPREVYEQNERYINRYMKFFLQHQGETEVLETELKRVDNQWKEWLLKVHGTAVSHQYHNLFLKDISDLLKVGINTEDMKNKIKNNSQNT